MLGGMNMSGSQLIKGAAIGVTVGAITYAMTGTSSKQKRRMKKTATRAMKSFGSMVEGISYMMR